MQKIVKYFDILSSIIFYNLFFLMCNFVSIIYIFLVGIEIALKEPLLLIVQLLISYPAYITLYYCTEKLLLDENKITTTQMFAFFFSSCKRYAIVGFGFGMAYYVLFICKQVLQQTVLAPVNLFFIFLQIMILVFANTFAMLSARYEMNMKESFSNTIKLLLMYPLLALLQIILGIGCIILLGINPLYVCFVMFGLYTVVEVYSYRYIFSQLEDANKTHIIS